MIKQISLSVAVVALVSLTFTGATGCGANGGGMDAGSDPDLTCDASTPATPFSKVYAEIFAANMTCTGCHLATSPDGSGSYGLYNTETAAYGQVGADSKYAGTAKKLKVVDPNNLGNSSMWLKVLGKAKSPEGQNVGSQMPLGLAALTAAQKTTMKNWICSGAKM